MRQFYWEIRFIVLIIILFVVGVTTVDAQDDSIWRRCDVEDVNQVVYVSGQVNSERLVTDWPLGVVQAQILTIRAVLGLRGELIQWDTEIGFHIDERLHHLGWLVLAADDEAKVYAQIWIGRDSDDLYILATDDMTHYVADYGGCDCWHVKCGGWRVE